MLVIQLRPSCTSFWISYPLFQGSFFKFCEFKSLFCWRFFFFHWLPCVRFPLQLSPRIQYSSTYLVYKMPERGLFLLFCLFFTAFCNIPHLSVIFNITLLNWSLCHSGTKSSFSLRDEFQIPRNGIIFIGSSHLSSFQISFF